jgi:hypothetical protein
MTRIFQVFGKSDSHLKALKTTNTTALHGLPVTLETGGGRFQRPMAFGRKVFNEKKRLKHSSTLLEPKALNHAQVLILSLGSKKLQSTLMTWIRQHTLLVRSQTGSGQVSWVHMRILTIHWMLL